MNNDMVRQQRDDARMSQYQRFVEKLRTILLVRTGHAPMSVNHCRKRAWSRRDNNIRCNDSAVRADRCAPIRNWTGIGYVKDFYPIMDLETLLLSSSAASLMLV